MKYASAMKYGGELVAAIECDYDSFKQLVPLCPNCKEPVYLRAGGDRVSSKGKAYKVGAHWCHFKGVSEEQVASCENRVNSYSEKDKQRIAAKARGQRLKLLQRWFWSVFKSFNQDYLTVLDDTKRHDHHEDFIPTVQQVAKTHKNMNLVLEEIAYALTFFGGVYTWQHPTDQANCITHLDQYIPRFFMVVRSGVSSELHKKQTLEVFNFLLTKKNYKIFRDITIHSFEECIADFAYAHHSGEPFYPTEHNLVGFTIHVLNDLLAKLLIIPWASEFQRLEAESKQSQKNHALV